MAVRVDESLDGIDWVQAKADLAADDFDNGRSPQALRASFDRSQHVAIARDGDRVVGMARLLSDGVCNAYLLDVWTMSAYRRQGIGATMVRQLMSRVPGQHIGLQTDNAEAFYTSIGYCHQPVFMSTVVGEWLSNEANASLRDLATIVGRPESADLGCVTYGGTLGPREEPDDLAG
ncbi:MAG TPA: GNAT family N-acetyltransferase [Streptosporangiaceae bacterium]|nr:GNAT family N-acetyltransferase [Streptosporangiaceae bacterium]